MDAKLGRIFLIYFLESNLKTNIYLVGLNSTNFSTYTNISSMYNTSGYIVEKSKYLASKVE